MGEISRKIYNNSVHTGTSAIAWLVLPLALLLCATGGGLYIYFERKHKNDAGIEHIAVVRLFFSKIVFDIFEYNVKSMVDFSTCFAGNELTNVRMVRMTRDIQHNNATILLLLLGRNMKPSVHFSFRSAAY